MARTTERLRVVGSFCLVLGYVLVISDQDSMGLPIRIIGNVTMIPFSLQWKMYDVVAMQVFFGIVTVIAMFHS